MASVVQWAGTLEAIYARQSGGQLAWLYNPFRVAKIPGDDTPYRNRQKLLRENEVSNISDVQLKTFLDSEVSSIPDKLKEVTRIFFGLLQASFNNRWRQVIALGLDAIDIWVSSIRDLEVPGWTSAGLASIIGFCIDIADRTESTSCLDDEMETDGGCQNLQRILNGIRKHIGKFRGESDVSQIGVYTILLTESIRLCLKLNNPPMATAFLKTIPSQQLPPRSQRGPATRFKFYYGNLMLQKEQFHEATDPLNWALAYCPSKSTQLRRQILACLIAAKIHCGYLPTRQLTEANNLQHYDGIIEAIRTGNLHLFDATMSQHAQQFYAEGTTICLNKSKLIAQQTLCIRVYNWINKYTTIDANSSQQAQTILVPDPPNIIHLNYFTAALRLSSQDDGIDAEETMCIIAHLIQQGLIKGYIAWQQCKLVLSKINPFPSIVKTR
ncbi:PCI domain protein [Gregarina niphandrodes]|uniref:PCI domain protein n=1 Tax=Gregarina niphandrodes TaxID=110365 RepID=A0A023AXY7_GRENI|nr:PCI domain protein [Gregarina niphandrodes]EZG43521.1 PCI domain protein [Gregarina niphandrodes]|eukprot:XP_011133248.1 PCI domain protein [Gregarina niphandrodes]